MHTSFHKIQPDLEWVSYNTLITLLWQCIFHGIVFSLATTRIPIDRLELEDTEPDFEGVRLAWNKVEIPPYHSDEEPLLYMVEMSEPPLDEWRPVVTGLPTTRYRVTDLLPDRDYRFRVRAVTPYGVTPPSYALPVSYRRPLPGMCVYNKAFFFIKKRSKITWSPFKFFF